MDKLELKNIYVEASADALGAVADKGRKPVVQDVSLTLAAGSVSVLMGPNGCGKSTLVNAIMGHPNYCITAGTAILDGEDITKLPTDKKAQKGLFLSLQHIPKVGGINLATFLHKIHTAMTGEDIDVLAYYLKLRELAGELSIDEALLDRPLTAGLSGGEKKLSEVLQLAALKPKFAILDEIDSGVDVDALKKVFGTISKLRDAGTGFLLISHAPSLLDHIEPDHVYVMNAGILIQSGGKELAEMIHREGFCGIANCSHINTCEGVCDDES